MKKNISFIVFILVCLLPSAVGAYYFGNDLQPGIESPDVLQLQKFLNTNPQTVVAAFGSGASGYETSYYGERTRAALYSFQSLPDKGITERDGIFRSATRAAVNQLSQSQLQLNVTTGQQPTPSAGTSDTTSGYGLGGYSLGGYGLGGQATPRVTGPVITRLSPNRGTAGTQMLLSGSGFQPTNNYVLFQDRSIGPLFSNGSTMNFIVPSTGACGDATPCSILVANSTGTSQAAARFIFDQPFVPPLPSGVAASGSGSILTFSVAPAVLTSKDPVTMVFSGTDSVQSYRIRFDCAKDVAATSDIANDLCRSTNVVKTSASPLTIRIANATGQDQTVTAVLTAHDARGNLLDSRTQNVVIRPAVSYTQTINTPGSPFVLSMDGILDDGTSVVPPSQGSTLVRAISVSSAFSDSASYLYGYGFGYTSGYSTASVLAQSVTLTVSVSGLANLQASITPNVVYLQANQSAQAQLLITPQSNVLGDYRITVTGVSGGYTQTKSFILRIGSAQQSPYQQTQTSDLVINYVGAASIARGQSFSPFFAVRELNNVSFTPTAVRVTLYDFMYGTSGYGTYGYQPLTFSDQNRAIGTSQLTVSPGYTNSQVYLGGGYTITQPGSYTVCATIDTTNLLQETSKANNIGCGTVQVN